MGCGGGRARCARVQTLCDAAATVFLAAVSANFVADCAFVV